MRIEAVGGGSDLGVCYIVSDGPRTPALIIDGPPGVLRRVQQAVSALELHAEALVSSHGHWDSCADLAVLGEAIGAPLYAHAWDATRLADPGLTMEPGSPFKIRGCRADRTFADMDTLDIGSLHFTVLHTPGHSPGSVCLYEARRAVLFAGDTLLAGSVGSTDHPGGNARLLSESLQRLSTLPGRTRVLPGHGKPTTIGAEQWLLQLAG